MTFRYLVFSSILLASRVRAEDRRIEIAPVPARKIFSALEAVGVHKAREANDTETLPVSNLDCIRHSGRNYVPSMPPTFDCTLVAKLSSAAEAKRLEIGGESASRIYAALEAVGLRSDCGMGSCGIPVSELGVERKGKTYVGHLITDAWHGGED